MARIAVFLTTALIGQLLLSCTRSNNGSSTVPTLDGVYDVGSISCLSTEASPRFPDANRKAGLYQFASLDQHRWEISGGSLTETFINSDCRLTISQRLSRNTDTGLELLQYRSHLWEPEECAQKVELEGAEFSYDRNAEVLMDSDADTIDIAFSVTAVDDTFLITSLSEEPYESYWSSFGCDESDAIYFVLTPVDDSDSDE